MKNRRLSKYLQARNAGKQNQPILDKKGVLNHPDNHIDQDFKGFPHGTADENIINPGTGTQKKVAAVNTKDGEKINRPPVKKRVIEEPGDDGSGNAFEATEEVKE